MALAGDWVRDNGGRYGTGPVDGSTGAGKGRRAANVSGGFVGSESELARRLTPPVLLGLRQYVRRGGRITGQ